ncbi:hypothetical protein NUSPORA_01616 [Nucleospora cyclopteri]
MTVKKSIKTPKNEKECNFDCNLMNSEQLLKISKKISRKNYAEILIKMWEFLSNELEIEESKKDEFIETVQAVNLKLKKVTPENLHFYIIDNVKFKEEKSQRKTVMEIFSNVIMQTLIVHSKTELMNSIEIGLNSSKKTGQENMHVINAIYRGIDEEFDKKLVCCIGFLLEPEGMSNFLNFIIKMDYRRKNKEENLQKLEYKFLEILDRLFLYIKINKKETYKKMWELLYSEKRYFKEIIVKNMPEIDIDQVLNKTRDYNFNVLASLLKDRPHITDAFIQKYSSGDLLIPKKSFLEKICEYDHFFADKIVKLNLDQFELIELCDKSGLFMQQYFSHKAGPMHDLCKIFANKGEEFAIEFIKSNMTHQNLPLLVKTMGRTVRLTGQLKDYLVENFSEKAEYFNALLPYVSSEKLELLISHFYKPKESLSGLLRKFHPMDLLLELHRFSDGRVVQKIFHECLMSDKFKDTDFIFLLKYLESNECLFKFQTCLALLKNYKSLQKQCLIFLENTDEITEDPVYVECLEQIDCMRIIEKMNNINCIEVVKQSELIRKKLAAYFIRNKSLNTKMKELKGLLKM